MSNTTTATDLAIIDRGVSDIDVIEADFTTILKPAKSIKGTLIGNGAKSRDLWMVPIDKIHIIPGFNPRVENESYIKHVEETADSILTQGYYQEEPLAGYAGFLNGEEVVFAYGGHTRLRAAKLAIARGREIIRLPVSVNQDGLSMDKMTIALIRGNSGKPLTFYESAIVCQRLTGSGYTIEEISTETGLSIPSIKSRYSLLAAPKRLREMVAFEKISATFAIEMITTHGEQALEKIDAAMLKSADKGKTRVTKAITLTTVRSKSIKKAAPALFDAAESVKKDPGYASLSMSTRQMIDELLMGIQAKIDKKIDKQTTINPNQLELPTLS